MQFYDLIKSRVECHGFREKIELAQVSLLQDLAGKISLCLLVVEINFFFLKLLNLAEEEGSSWDVVSEDDILGVVQTEDDYVVVREEDIADGIACFMATYLSSLKQTKVRRVH